MLNFAIIKAVVGGSVMASNSDLIIEKLKNWNCDIDGVMDRFLGNKDFYVELLNEVPSQVEFINLGKHLKENDIKDSFADAHTLKGVLANMGLTPMFNEVCDIVEPLRIGSMDGVNEHYLNLLKELDFLKKILILG